MATKKLSDEQRDLLDQLTTSDAEVVPAAASTPLVQIETVTPELAEDWLKGNTRNRPIRPHLITGYARDMAAGRWTLTGEAVKFAADGTLLDGQHRLLAIVQADVPVQLCVVRGLDLQAQNSMDIGAKRTTADALRLNGDKYGKTLAAVARMILTEGDKTRYRPTNAELIAFVEKDETLRWVLETVSTGDIYTLRRITSPTVIAYAYWRLHAIDPYATAEFFGKLATLVNLPEGSPILVLHKRLSAHMGKANGRAYRREVLAYIFMSWNAWRRNESRSIVKLSYTNGELSIPEPI